MSDIEILVPHSRDWCGVYLVERRDADGRRREVEINDPLALYLAEVVALPAAERDAVVQELRDAVEEAAEREYLARCRTPHGVKVGTSLIVDVAEGERRALQWRAEQREGRRA